MRIHHIARGRERELGVGESESDGGAVYTVLGQHLWKQPRLLKQRKVRYCQKEAREG